MDGFRRGFLYDELCRGRDRQARGSAGHSMTMVMVTFLSGGIDMVSESDLGTAAHPVVIAITSAINSIFMGISSVCSSKL